MANLLFLTHVRRDDTSGVWKKVLAQCSALKRLGFNVDFVYEDGNNLAIETNQGIQIIALKHRYFLFYTLSKNINRKYDFVYLRKPHGGFYPLFSSLVINKIKRNNRNSSIYMEIPTYPYAKEQVGLKGFISDLTYKFAFFLFKNKLKEILYIGTGPDKINGVKARKIINGVDLVHVECAIKTKKENDVFVFAGIANLMYWHGYDRLIRSIAHYDGPNQIKCYIIGDSEPEFSRLKSVAKDENIENKIIFSGRLIDKDIKDILKDVNVCVDALGRHRSGNNINSSIKSKDYTAMGMPFIKSHIDDAFDNKDFFIFQVEANENDIPIDSIITWYQSLPQDFPVKERQVAKDRFSWDEILKPIFDITQGNK